MLCGLPGMNEVSVKENESGGNVIDNYIDYLLRKYNYVQYLLATVVNYEQLESRIAIKG